MTSEGNDWKNAEVKTCSTRDAVKNVRGRRSRTKAARRSTGSTRNVAASRRRHSEGSSGDLCGRPIKVTLGCSI